MTSRSQCDQRQHSWSRPVQHSRPRLISFTRCAHACVQDRVLQGHGVRGQSAQSGMPGPSARGFPKQCSQWWAGALRNRIALLAQTLAGMTAVTFIMK